MPLTHYLLVRAGGRDGSDSGNGNSSKNVGVDIMVPIVASPIRIAILVAAFLIERRWRKRGEPKHGDHVVRT